MTDEEFISHMEAKCTEVIIGGGIIDHWWLGNTKHHMEKDAGCWAVKINAANMCRLIELAKRGMEK